MLKLLIFILPILLTTNYLLPTVHAQSQARLPDGQGIEVTSVYEVADRDAVEGDILKATDKGLIRTTIGFDNKIFGIIADSPLLIFRSETKGKPVIRSGIAQVNVTTLNGPIKYGDYITSSSVAGKGQKATESGYTVGMALGAFNGEGKTA